MRLERLVGPASLCLLLLGTLAVVGLFFHVDLMLERIVGALLGIGAIAVTVYWDHQWTLARTRTGAAKVALATIGRPLLIQQLLDHPLPWRVVRDWTFAVTAADGHVVAKCMKPDEAEAIVRLADTLDADMKEAALTAV